MDTFNFLLNLLFLNTVQKIKNRFFFNLERTSRFCIVILNGAKKFNIPLLKRVSDWLNSIDLEIKKKKGLSINLHIHYSKVFSSVYTIWSYINVRMPPKYPELETFEWWISVLMLDPLFFLFLRSARNIFF